jgi:hypothetical protein
VCSVADPDPGSGIGCLFDPWIRDPGWEKVSIRIRDEQPGSYFLELRNNFFAFFWVKIVKFFDEDPGSGMEIVRSGMEKSRIRDKHPGSATLLVWKKEIPIQYVLLNLPVQYQLQRYGTAKEGIFDFLRQTEHFLNQSRHKLKYYF